MIYLVREENRYIMADKNNHFTVIVAGENPDELIKQYDNNLKVEKYIVYKFSDAEKYKKNTANLYKQIIASDNVPDVIREEYAENLKQLQSEDVIDFYSELTDGFEIDQNTGDAISDRNPNGKYEVCRLGKYLAMPLVTNNGDEVFQARKKDINWKRINLGNQKIYEVAWDMVMNGKEPSNEDERTIYENMKNRKEYFRHYGTKEKYVASSTAFWGYAFLDNKAWVEIQDGDDEIDWILGFYKRFIKYLPENTLISVYECIRN